MKQLPQSVIDGLLSAPVTTGSSPHELYINYAHNGSTFQLWIEYYFDEALILTEWKGGASEDAQPIWWDVPEVLKGLRGKLVLS